MLQAESLLSAMSRLLLRPAEEPDLSPRSHGSLLDASKDCAAHHGSLRRSAGEKIRKIQRDSSKTTMSQILICWESRRRTRPLLHRIFLSEREKQDSVPSFRQGYRKNSRTRLVFQLIVHQKVWSQERPWPTLISLSTENWNLQLFSVSSYAWKESIK